MRKYRAGLMASAPIPATLVTGRSRKEEATPKAAAALRGRETRMRSEAGGNEQT